MSEGHSQAARYPICTVWNEVDVARRRIHTRIATDATMMHTVISTAISGKTGHLEKVLKELNGG